MKNDTIITGGYYWDDVNKNLIVGNNQAKNNNINIFPNGTNIAVPIPITDEILTQALGFQQTKHNTFENQSYVITKGPLNNYYCVGKEVHHVDDVQDLCKDLTVNEQVLKNLLNQP